MILVIYTNNMHCCNRNAYIHKTGIAVICAAVFLQLHFLFSFCLYCEGKLATYGNCDNVCMYCIIVLSYVLYYCMYCITISIINHHPSSSKV